jgi:hypothetical protein
MYRPDQAGEPDVVRRAFGQVAGGVQTYAIMYPTRLTSSSSPVCTALTKLLSLMSREGHLANLFFHVYNHMRTVPSGSSICWLSCTQA